MKVEIEVTQWWEISFVEEVEEHDLRSEPYTTKRSGMKVFIKEDEARDFIVHRLKKNTAYSHIVMKHCKEVPL